MFHVDLISAGAGFVLGAFTPGIGRIIKSWFVKESTAAKNAATSAASSAATAVKNAVDKKL